MAIDTIILDCARLSRPGLGTIDDIARLRIATQRNGCRLHLANAGTPLLELIQLCGLSEVLGVESRGQAKQRKEPCRVEKEGDVGNLTP
jgi:hypothetical protein